MCEYTMTKEMAEALIKAAKRKVDNPQKYLVDVVNEQFGIIHPVTKVNVTL